MDYACHPSAHCKLTPCLAGIGKTILSAASVNHLKNHALLERRVVVTYAFLQTEKKPVAKDVIAGLLGQILEYKHCDVTRPTNSHAFNSGADCERDVNPIAEALNLVLSAQGREPAGGSLSQRELIVLFGNVVGLFHRVFVVLDGLDEAPDAAQATLLATFAPLACVALLITSRPLGGLPRRHAPGASMVDIRSLNDGDIELCLKHRIENEWKLSALLSGDGSTEAVNQGALSQGAERMLIENRVKTLSAGM